MITTKSFIDKAKSVHGNKYDYRKVDYVKAIIPIIIICLKHGDFFQSPNSHLAGKGCNKCGQESRKLTLTETWKKRKNSDQGL